MKAALIGLGPQGRRLAQAVALVPGVELAGGCDARPGAFPEDFAAARFADAVEMLRTLSPGVVLIATNAPSHATLAKAAMQGGARHIFVEKPFTCSVAEAARVVEEAARVGARVVVNHCRRTVPAYRWLRSQIRIGRFGLLRSIDVFCPGIGLGCLGTHFIDLIRFLSGDDIVLVSGWIDAPRAPNPRGAQFVDPGGVIVMRTRGGSTHILRQIEDAPGPHMIELHFTEGRVQIDERNRRVEAMRRGQTVDLPPDAVLDLDMVRMSAEVLRELVSPDAPSCEATHGLRSLEIVAAAYASDRRGHAAVGVPTDDPAVELLELPIT